MFARLGKTSFESGISMLLGSARDQSKIYSFRFFVLAIESVKVWRAILPGLVTQNLSGKLHASLKGFERWEELIEGDYYVNLDVMNLKDADSRFIEDNKLKFKLPDNFLDDLEQKTSEKNQIGKEDRNAMSRGEVSRERVTFGDFDSILREDSKKKSVDKRFTPKIASKFAAQRPSQDSAQVKFLGKARMAESFSITEKDTHVTSHQSDFLSAEEAVEFQAKLPENEFDCLKQIDGFLAAKQQLISLIYNDNSSVVEISTRKYLLQEKMNQMYDKIEGFLFFKSPCLAKKQQILMKELEFVNLLYDAFLCTFDSVPDDEKDIFALREKLSKDYQVCFGKDIKSVLKKFGDSEKKVAPVPTVMKRETAESHNLKASNGSVARMLDTKLNNVSGEEAAGPTEVNGMKLHKRPIFPPYAQLLPCKRESVGIWPPNPFTKSLQPPIRKQAVSIQNSSAKKQKLNFYVSILEMEQNDQEKINHAEPSSVRPSLKDVMAASKLRCSSLSVKPKPPVSNIKIAFGGSKPPHRDCDSENKENSLHRTPHQNRPFDNDSDNANDVYAENLSNSRLKFQKFGLRLATQKTQPNHDVSDNQNANQTINLSIQNSQRKNQPYEVSEFLEPDVLSRLEEDNSALKEKKKQLESQILEISGELNRQSENPRTTVSKRNSKFDRNSLMNGSHRSNSFRLLKSVDDPQSMMQEFYKKEGQFSALQRKYETLVKKMQSSAFNHYYGDQDALDDAKRVMQHRRSESESHLVTSGVGTLKRLEY